VVGLVQAADGTRDTGVVDQRGEGPEGRRRLIEEPLDLLRVAAVSQKGQCLASGSPDRLDGAQRRLLVGDIGDRHAPALRGQEKADRSADATAAPGHEDGPVLACCVIVHEAASRHPIRSRIRSLAPNFHGRKARGIKKVPDRLRRGRGRGREAGPGPSQFVAELNRK